MRLWHQQLIPLLPRNQLLGQHRECCALRGKGWNRKHSTVDYVFEYSPYLLFAYHQLVMDEMTYRGYKVSTEWLDKDYRGKNTQAYNDLAKVEVDNPIYPEHNEAYLKECIENLADKDILIDINEIES